MAKESHTGMEDAFPTPSQKDLLDALDRNTAALGRMEKLLDEILKELRADAP